jgi:hypothetical protein
MSMGRRIAKEISDAHEGIYYGRMLGSMDRYRRMDLENNRIGINLGMSIPRSQYTGSFGVVRQGVLVPLMRRPCLEALRRGSQDQERPGGLTWFVPG